MLAPRSQHGKAGAAACHSRGTYQRRCLQQAHTDRAAKSWQLVLARKGRTAEQLQCASLVRRNAGEAASGLARCHPLLNMHSRRPNQTHGSKGAHNAAIHKGPAVHSTGGTRSVPRLLQAHRGSSDKPTPAIAAELTNQWRERDHEGQHAG